MENTTLIVASWFGNKLLGKTIEVIGNDLSKLYEIGKNKIVEKALKKTKDIDKEGLTNLRVTRDIFWSGAFSDEEICAEYFGGVLASSRTEDGKDDSGVFFLDIIKSLSAEQLKMHYMIYRTLNKMWVADEQKKNLNPGAEKDFGELFFCLHDEIQSHYDLGVILHGLSSKVLIRGFGTETGQHISSKNVLRHLVEVQPSSLGIQLFAIANNRFKDWRSFPLEDFGDFDNISLPLCYARSLEALHQKLVL